MAETERVEDEGAALYERRFARPKP